MQFFGEGSPETFDFPSVLTVSIQLFHRFSAFSLQLWSPAKSYIFKWLPLFKPKNTRVQWKFCTGSFAKNDMTTTQGTIRLFGAAFLKGHQKGMFGSSNLSPESTCGIWVSPNQHGHPTTVENGILQVVERRFVVFAGIFRLGLLNMGIIKIDVSRVWPGPLLRSLILIFCQIVSKARGEHPYNPKKEKKHQGKVI